MKTNTRAQIIKIINKKGKTRPVELVKALNISPQALHRQLKKLLTEGTLEVHGQMPLTYYALANIPDFTSVLIWASTKAVPKPSPSVCETRDIFSARLNSLTSYVKQGLPSENLSLVVSTAGEVGNNCFDHNLGKWRDTPGCWFESQKTKSRLWICIADRGQGIFQSLSTADKKISNEQVAIESAFEKQISGRAPENRGNGLKFVKNSILKTKGSGIACQSGTATIDYGEMGQDCRKVLKNINEKIFGTFTIMVWSLYES